MYKFRQRKIKELYIFFLAIFFILFGTLKSAAQDLPVLPPVNIDSSVSELPKELGGAIPNDLMSAPVPEPVPVETKKEEKVFPLPNDELKNLPAVESPKNTGLPKVVEEKKLPEVVPEGLKPVVEKKSEEKPVENKESQKLPEIKDIKKEAPAKISEEELKKIKLEKEKKELQELVEEKLQLKEPKKEIEKKSAEEKIEAPKDVISKEEPPKSELPTAIEVPEAKVFTPTVTVPKGKENPIVFSANSILRITPKPDPNNPELDDAELNFVVNIERGREVFADDIIIKENFVDDDHGSLFVYPSKQEAVLNLSKLYVPRDILFINEFGEIVEIMRKVPPRTATPMRSREPVLFVLQLNPGVVRKYAIRVGDRAFVVAPEDIIK